jgi:hypothetical protein
VTAVVPTSPEVYLLTLMDSEITLVGSPNLFAFAASVGLCVRGFFFCYGSFYFGLGYVGGESSLFSLSHGSFGVA